MRLPKMEQPHRPKLPRFRHPNHVPAGQHPKNHPPPQFHQPNQHLGGLVFGERKSVAEELVTNLTAVNSI